MGNRAFSGFGILAKMCDEKVICLSCDFEPMGGVVLGESGCLFDVCFAAVFIFRLIACLLWPTIHICNIYLSIY